MTVLSGRLMPIECFRLQGFSDEQFQTLVDIGIPETQLYRMAGNSVTTNVVTAVADQTGKRNSKPERRRKCLIM